MNFTFSVLSNKRDIANLNLRFYHGRKINCYAPTFIMIDSRYWSNKLQRCKNDVDDNLKKKINTKINSLKEFIVDQFNDDFSNGESIDSSWLKRVIEKFHNRPKDGDSNWEVYFIPWVRKFIDESPNRVIPQSKKLVSSNTLKKYETTYNLLIEIEEKYNIRLKHRDIDLKFYSKMYNYFLVDKKYVPNTIGKYIKQVKTFATFAKKDEMPISNEINSPDFVIPKEDTIDTYLSPTEIDIIFNLKLPKDGYLDNARDWLIIGLWSGQRISDFLTLGNANIRGNNIEILDTKKANKTVIIPIHSQIKSTLKKHNNQLPRKISDSKFNLYIKEVCKEAGLTEEIMGKLKNPETNRKEIGHYPKYKLISSHTCRRSFLSNHYGKLPNKTLRAISRHSTEAQLMEYVKTTQQEHVEEIRAYWEKLEKEKLEEKQNEKSN